MRKSKRMPTKTILSFLLCIALILPLTQTLLTTQTYGLGMGTLVFNERREIAKGVYLDTWQGKETSGKPKKGYSISFNPQTSDAQVMAVYGDSIKSRMTLSKMMASAEQQGYIVIGGINGDFYHLDNGVPLGLVIRDGKVISNNSASSNAIGFKQDGSVVIGSPQVEIKGVLDNGDTFNIAHLNKAQGEWGPYMYTSEYGTTTGSTEPSIEAVIEINAGDTTPGNLMLGTVTAVKTDTKSTPIGKNQIVLSARTGKYGASTIAQLKVGSVIGITLSINDPNWTGVKEAIGGSNILISKGQINSTLSSTNLNPTTAIGVKANGEVVLLEVDGRNDALSVGMSSMDAAKFLQEQGCVDAIQLDGGGSSTIAARMPGSISPSVLNKPSDGSERANSNAIILVSKQAVKINQGQAVPTLDARLLHVYPGKALALPGGILNFSAKATDDYFFPVYTPQDIKWSTNGGLIDSTGAYMAPAQAGTYQVTASSGVASGNGTVVVLNPGDITKIVPTKTSIGLLPGTSQALTAEARYNDIKVASNSSHFKWEVEGNIGTITPEGVFTAKAGGDQKGRIKVSLGSATAYIDVALTQEPVVIESFENGNGWSTSLVRAASGSATIVENYDIAAFGNKALRLDYDFTLTAGVEKGVAGLYATKTVDGVSGIALDRNPTAIGMWVYGDNSKNWLRAKVKDGKGESFDIDFTAEYRPDTKTGGINWTGWKYVEAQIPSGRQGPFTLETPIRVMCTRDELRTSGTLYMDNIRVIYGAKNDDLTAPTGSITMPVDQSVLSTGKVDFKAEISDNLGIDEKSIKLYLDGAAVESPKIGASGTGYQVETTLGATTPLADGLHNLVLRFSDIYGNKGVKQVSFTVDTGAPQVMASSPATAFDGETFGYTVSVKNPNNLRKLYMIINYNKDALTVVDADPKTEGVQVALEGWMKNGKIINNKVDTENGRIYIEVDNLKANTKESMIQAFRVDFTPKTTTLPSTEISLNVGAMIVGQNKSGSRFSLPISKINIGYSMTISASGLSSGETTTITVIDRDGNPVEGAGIYYNGMTEYFLMTGKDGKAQTTALTDLPVGHKCYIQAKKDGMISNILNITIGEAK